MVCVGGGRGSQHNMRDVLLKGGRIRMVENQCSNLYCLPSIRFSPLSHPKLEKPRLTSI